PEVPAEIDCSAYRSVSELIDASFDKFRESPAFACDGTLITYGELDAMSRSLAAWLQSRGLERGARVAIMMPNVLPYPVSICAVLRAGYV
ncbi:AMP-binding protein, partial [Paraburkholderia sp. SIMBA_050]